MYYPREDYRILVVAGIVSLLVCRGIEAITFDYVVLATSDTQAPGEAPGETLGTMPLPSMAGGRVVFLGRNRSGIYAYRDGQLEVLVNHTTHVPDAPEGTSFSGFDAPTLDADFNVAFRGQGSGGGFKGIYTVSDGQVNKIADTTTSIPGTSPPVAFAKFSDPWISDGQVVFRGSGTGVSGIYTNAGGTLRAVASTATDIPDGTGTFTSFGKTSLGGDLVQTPSIGGGNISFYGEGLREKGIYAEMNGSLIRIADTNTLIPDGRRLPFPGFDVNFALSSATYDGGVVFVAGLDQENVFPDAIGIYKWWGGSLFTVADLTTRVPETGGTLTTFGNAQGLSFRNHEYSFLGQETVGPQSIFAIVEGQLVRVIANGDLIDGRPAGAFGSYGQGIEDGSVVFNVGSFDGLNANVAAIQAHRWQGAGADVYGQPGDGNDWNDVSNWTLGQLPRGVVPTVIDPGRPTTVNGPTDDVEIASLQVGTGVNLWLQSSGSIHAIEGTVISQNAKLTGSGRISGLLTNNGTLHATDIVAGPIQNNGHINVSMDSSFTLNSLPLDNDGTIEINGTVTTGDLTNGGVVELEGTLTSRDLINHGDLTGRGSIHGFEFQNHAGLDVARVTLGSSFLNYGLATIHRLSVNGCIDNFAGAEMVLAGGTARLDGSDEFHNFGILRGSGFLNTSYTENSGEIRVGTSERLVFSGYGFSSALIEVLGGEMEFKGLLNNNADALIAGRNATMRFGDVGLVNDGGLALSFGTSDVFGNIENRAGGRIVVTGQSNATFYGDVENEGVIQVSAGSSAVFLGSFTGTQGTSGTGTVFLEGDLQPGNSPASLAFGGDLVLGAAAHFGVELGGLLAGTEFDQLRTAGDLILEGWLDVSLIDSFRLDAGQSFEILDIAGTQAGTFQALAEGDLVGTFDGTPLFISYSGGDGNDVVLFTTFLAGDFNEDSAVDAADAALLFANWGPVTGPSNVADLNGDDLVDAADAAVVFSNWTGDSTLHTVPEPRAILLFSGLLGLVLHRLRRVACPIMSYRSRAKSPPAACGV